LKNIFFLSFLFNFCLLYAIESISLRSLGAKGDGVTDDTAVLIKAIKMADVKGMDITGENLNYKLSGSHELSLKKLSLSDIKICFDNDYKKQFNIKINSNNIKLSNINVAGGRGTYNKNIEQWRVFSEEAKVKSIEPVPSHIFYFVTSLNTATISIDNFYAKDIHAQSCLTVYTLGKVYLQNLNFSNISNKTFQVYHTFDDGKTQAGETHLDSAVAKNIGILPVQILVDGKMYKTALGTYMPQSSFNFIVTGGNFYASNINVNNYASTGLTADRNLYFEAKNVNLSSNISNIYSNNPSGALWFEACKKAYVKDVKIIIKNRSKLDLNFDNSAVHFYGVNSNIVIDNMIIQSDKLSLNKGVRGSLSGENFITINNLDVTGGFKSEAVFFASLDSDMKNTLSFGNVTLRSNNMVFDMMKSVNLNNVIGITKNEIVSYRLPVGISKIGNFSLKKSNLNQVEVSARTKDIVINKNINVKKIIYK